MSEPSCAFCGLPEEETLLLISGKNAHICETCAERVVTLVRKELAVNQEEEPAAAKVQAVEWESLKPIDLKAHLDDYVIGQDRAKKILSVAVYNHYKRLAAELKREEEKAANPDEVELTKSNVILLGPSGVGKTLMVETIARHAGVPCVIADATSLTQEGYVGQDPDSVVLKAYHAAGQKVALAEKSIVYIDEFDKLRAKSENTSITRDVGGGGGAGSPPQNFGRECGQCPS